MKLVTYRYEGRVCLGIWRGERVIPVPAQRFPADMLDMIAAWPEVHEELAEWLAGESENHAFNMGEIELLSPLTRPGKVAAIGLNYRDHCLEANLPVPVRPLVFAKFVSSLAGPRQAVCFDPRLTQQVDFECELGVVIGRRARNVPEERALEYVFGYTIVNDISARDLQFSDGQWVRSKSLDTFCPVGPCIVTRSEIANPQALRLRCSVNGAVMQDSSTAEMIFGVAHLVADLSQAFTLEPGDLIATGTPAGVGMSRKPPVFLKDGDMLVSEIESIGRLENPIRQIQFPADSSSQGE